MSGPRLTLLAATVFVGLSAGFFFTYEVSVTLGLAEVDDTTYVETFRAINDTIRNPVFGVVFFGSIPAIVVAIAANWSSMPPIGRALVAAALPLYLVGLIVTAAGNVPLNDDLADVGTITPTVAATAREDFEDEWNRLNLIRALAVGASFAALAAGGLIASDRRAGQGIGTASDQTA